MTVAYQSNPVPPRHADSIHSLRRGERKPKIKTMRIAQVAPLYESVPPKYYGGTERVVSYLTEALTRLGHEVTLFASGDSITSAQLVAACPQSLRLDKTCVDQLAHHLLMLEHVLQRADEFDIVHFHVDYLHFPLSRRQRFPQVTTLHGRLDTPDIVALHREYWDMPLVSISDAQRKPIPWANWQATVYHGLPENLYHFRPEPGTYLAFLGRISPEKRVDRAIEIAKRLDLPLKIAAKVDRVDTDYFNAVIAPLLDHPLVEFIGEIGEADKDDFLGKAYALLFPIDWPEPFGLVMIESMACGTPVIAYRRGSVPEIMQHGKTGFIASSLGEAVSAGRRISQINRRVCRDVFEQRFTAKRMAENYLGIYEALTGNQAIRPYGLTHDGKYHDRGIHPHP